MSKYTVEVDLEIIENGLTRLIDICDKESNYLQSSLKFNESELDKLTSQKEDLMQFLSMNIHVITKYIKLHRNELYDDLKSLFNTQESLNIEIAETVNSESLEIIFINDRDDMPKRISSLLKAMIQSIKHNSNVISARKHISDMLISYAKKALDNQNRSSYSPRKGCKTNFSPVIHNQNC